MHEEAHKEKKHKRFASLHQYKEFCWVITFYLEKAVTSSQSILFLYALYLTNILYVQSLS